MAGKLQIDVMLRAVEQVTKPLKKIREGSGKTADALRESKEQLRKLQRSQRDISSYRRLQDAMRDNQEALGGAQEKLRRLREGMGKTDAPTDRLQRQFIKAKEEVKKLNDKIGIQSRDLGTLRTSLRESGISTDNLGRSEDQLATRIREANTQFDAQKRKLGEIAEAQRRAQRAKDKFHRNIGRANSIRGAGMTGLATGGAGLYAGARMLTPGVEYGEQMSAVQAVGRFDANDEGFKALKQQSRDLGSSTAFSASEVGAGQEFLLRAGMSAKAIKSSMKDVLNLALANNTELGRTADIASNIAGTFKIDLEKEGAMGHVADVLSATASRANVDLEKLGETVKYLGGAEDLDLTLEQASAMAGLLGNIGIQGSQAGTTLRGMMNRLTDPSKEAAAVIENLGIQISDADGQMRDMPDILRDINAATKDLGNADRKQALQKIFGAEAGSGMAELVSQMSTGALDDLIAKLQVAAGENDRMAEIMQDNIGGDLKGLRSAWEEVGISITDTNNGPLRELIQNVTTLTRAVGDWIKQNPELAGGIAKAAAGLAALVAVGGAFTIMAASVLGPLVTMKFAMEYLGLRARGADTLLGKFAKGGLKMLGGSLKWLGRIIAVVGRAFLLNPIGLAVTAIAGAAYLIYRNWDSISQFFKDRWRDVKAAFDEGVGGVMRLLLNWNPLGLVYKGVIATLRKMGVEVPDSIATLGDAIVNGLSAAWKGITDLWDWFEDAPDKAIDYVADLLDDWDLMGQLERKWNEAIDYLKSLPNRMLDAGKDVAAGLGEGIKNGAAAVKEQTGKMVDGAIAKARDLLNINSPSKVFREIGGSTVEGFNQGIDRQRKEPAQRMAEIARQVTQAGAGIALGAATLPVAAMPEIHASHDVALDTRPPMAAAPRNVTVEGDHITLNVYPSEGMDERALARLIGQMLDERERQKAARMRRNLYDND